MPGPSTDFIMPIKLAAYQEVPLILTALPLTTGVDETLAVLYAANDSGSERTLLVQDDAGLPVIPNVVMAPHECRQFPVSMGQFVGLSWQANGDRLYAQVLGWPTV